MRTSYEIRLIQAAAFFWFLQMVESLHKAKMTTSVVILAIVASLGLVGVVGVTILLSKRKPLGACQTPNRMSFHAEIVG